MSDRHGGARVNGLASDLQRWSSNPAIWFKEFTYCVVEWQMESFAGFFMGRPWGGIGTAFMLGHVSRSVLDYEDKEITVEVVSDFFEMAKREPIALTGEDGWVQSRFKMMLLSQSDGLSSPSELEAFIADAALLHCVLASSNDLEDALRFADEVLVDAAVELVRLRKENDRFLGEVIRGEHKNLA